MKHFIEPNSKARLLALSPKLKKNPGTNTQAYFGKATMTKMNQDFITLTPEANVIKLFTAVRCDFS